MYLKFIGAWTVKVVSRIYKFLSMISEIAVTSEHYPINYYYPTEEQALEALPN